LPQPAHSRPSSTQRRREAKIATAASHPSSQRQFSAETLAEDIYTTHRQRLLAIAKRNCNNPEDAEEALQDAFVLFINHFDPSAGAPPLAWITLTLKRECWARYRRGKRSVSYSHPDSATQDDEPRTPDLRRGPQETTELADSVATARWQLAQLKPAERRALGLFAIGYSYREICDITGWSYTKVNRCITEGRGSLRKLAEA
jgi:RNA polymerase sigma factor (sigma-70 family)